LNYRKLDKKYLPTFLNKLISNLWIGQFIRQIKRLDKFIVLSEEDKSYWKGIDNIIVINNPIKLIPSQYSSCKNKFAIAVGRYTDQKGFDLLIKIWKIVEKKHPDWYLNIYGSGNKEIYEEIALNLKVKNISFNSPIDNIYEKYQKSSIFLLSSRYEGFALVLAEAMSCGLPVISFDCPCGPKDIINNGINGILVKTGDIIDFANQICNIIENENKRREMGEIARNIVSKFNENDIMRQWISLFNQLTQ
jgi:glycosyltransferase involved in cell wall biosynthesis